MNYWMEEFIREQERELLKNNKMKNKKIRIEVLDENNKAISSSTISENKMTHVSKTKQWNDVIDSIIRNDGLGT